MRQLSSFLGDRQGGVLIEAAIVAPVLLILGLGAFEFSQLFFKHQAMTAGVRDAARYAARIPRPTGVSCDEALGDAQLVAAAKNLAVTGDINLSTPPRVKGWSTSDVVVTATTIENPVDPLTGVRAFRGPDPLCVVRVNTSYFHSRMGLFANFNMIPSTISVSHAERWIGG